MEVLALDRSPGGSARRRPARVNSRSLASVAATRDSAESREVPVAASSYGITQARKAEIAHLDRRHGDRLTRLTALARAHPHRRAHRFEVVEHEDRRIVEAHVLHRFRDLAVLDQERPVAREAGIEDRSLIDGAKIPEARDEEAALRGANQIVHRRRAARHTDRTAGTGRRALLFLRPIPVVVEILQNAV